MARTSEKRAEPIVQMSRSTRILQLMGTGASNAAIFAGLAADEPEVLEKDEERRKYNGNKYVPFNQKKRDDLLNQIRVCRNQYEQQQKQLAASIAAYGRGTVVTLNDAKPEPIVRISTGEPTLDWMWGFHEEEIKKGKNAKAEKVQIFGPPRSKITLLGGQRGVGKTRWIIATSCQMIAREKDPAKACHVLVNQNEVTQGEYGTWVRNYLKAADLPMWVLKHIHVADQPVIQDQLNTIRQLDEKTEGKLDWVVVDSIKMIKEANTEAGQYDLCYAYHDTCHRLSNKGPHVVFIGHMNKQGEIKGSTAIQHYVDIVFLATKGFIKGQFTLSCPEKNRYGETGKNRHFRHEGAMVVPVKQDGDEEIESLVELYHKARRQR